MPKTAVGLFEKPDIVDAVVREIEALGFPRKEIRTVEEPATFEAIGVMSFPRLEFEVALLRELTMIGTTKAEAQAYVEGMQRGGALVLATGSDERVEVATDILNRNGAVEVEEAIGSEPQLPGVSPENMASSGDSRVEAPRTRRSGGGACVFIW